MNNKLNFELAREYYKLAPKASLALCGLLAITLYFYWGKIPSSILVPWSCVIFVSATSGLIAARLFKRHGTAGNAGEWIRIYAYLVLFQEAPWGLIGPISFMTIDNDVFRLLTLFMLGGMGAGAIITRALVFKTYLLSLLALLAPIVITLALQRTTVANAMLSLVLVYLVFMLSVARGYSASIKRNIQLWLDNEQLVEQLRTSHAELEQANQALNQEIEYRKGIEIELTGAKERSDRASEAKNRFLATVSHELRTPLNGIMGFADLLQDAQLKQRQQRYVGQISKAAHTVLRIVNDILDITAIEAGHIRLYKETFSLRTELEDVVEILRPMAKQKKLSLKLRVDAEVADGLYGDVNRLRQIIGNLLSNALKYTETGHVSLTISCQDSHEGRVLLRFEVEDTGIGIETGALSSIFENFTRVENFETRRNEGVGLGLPIVKSLVQTMRGRLFVRSVPGQGSCFSFDIPFTQCGDLYKQVRQVEAAELKRQEWQQFNVLVVDDNQVNRMVLSSFLAKAGIRFKEACNGNDGLQQIRTGKFDAVLLDIQMPDISGLDVAKMVRTELASTPVLIAVTAHAFPEQRQRIFEAGFSDLLIKPIGMDSLLKILTQAYMGGYCANRISVSNC